jgi:hypothetical protein
MPGAWPFWWPVSLVQWAQDDPATIAGWLQVEQRDFGWGYLSAEPGEQAERAFVTLRDALGVG